MTSEAWHRRHAIQITAVLPETAEDALIVLELARELVQGFLRGPQPAVVREDLDRGNVVSLSSSTSGANR